MATQPVTIPPEPPTGSVERRKHLDALQCQAWEAFARDLDGLLQTSRGKWVAYRGPDRVCVGASQPAVFEECHRRGLAADELFVELVYPAAVELPEVFLLPPTELPTRLR
jgi:hypothetical protein